MPPNNTAHYTPSEMAGDIARRTIVPMIGTMSSSEIEDIRVCDPSCGDGQFLVETIRYLSEFIPVEQAVKCVYGVDIDSDAVSKARKRILDTFGVETDQIQCGEALLDFDWGKWPKFDCVVGNPPFLGGSKISGRFGAEYLKTLKRRYPQSGGTTDLSAYFFRLAHDITRNDATIGLIATNTISQGDTRTTGLQWLINHGCTVYEATRSQPWPGAAAVTVSVVHLAKGAPIRIVEKNKILDGQSVAAINSRLRDKPERPDPQKISHNANLSYVGSYVLGMGFTLTPEERDQLVARNPKNAERIFPYIGGEEVNTSPMQAFHRYVINFGQMSLEEASEWPDLIKIVREKVKPERDKVKRIPHKKFWWHYGDKRPALYQAIQDLPRCLVTAQVTKHLCFSFQPTDRIFSQKLFVFPFDDYAHFALLQSRIHEAWTWLLSSTLEERLNYSATDCFENFPFPEASRLSARSGVERVGRRVYEARARFMVETDQGLTKTYNALKDPECRDPRVEKLRDLHWEMDREVLSAYGWEDISVPAYGTCEKFNDEVVDRLHDLNIEQYRQEKNVTFSIG